VPDLHDAAGHGDEVSSGVEDIDDAVEVTDELMQQLDAGDWRAASEGGAGLAGASVLARALVEHTGQPIAVIRTHLGGMQNKVKLALRAEPAIAAIIRRLEDEKRARAEARGKSTAAAVDVGAALAALRGPAPAEASSETTAG
jgi:hypothetical protein